MPLQGYTIFTASCSHGNFRLTYIIVQWTVIWYSQHHVERIVAWPLNTFQWFTFGFNIWKLYHVHCLWFLDLIAYSFRVFHTQNQWCITVSNETLVSRYLYSYWYLWLHCFYYQALYWMFFFRLQCNARYKYYWWINMMVCIIREMIVSYISR